MSTRGTPGSGGERSFEEIGSVLGITRGGAWMLYRRAIRKLQRNPKALAILLELKTEMDRSKPMPDHSISRPRRRIHAKE